MKLQLISAKSLDRNLKATVHVSGKLGFTDDAQKKLKLEKGKSASIFRNAEQPNDDSLYVIINDEKNEDSFSVYKAGKYYYLNTKPFFESLKIDYIKGNIVYDITEITVDDKQVFKFARRLANKNVIGTPL
jgi:hypothetical protein